MHNVLFKFCKQVIRVWYTWSFVYPQRKKPWALNLAILQAMQQAHLFQSILQETCSEIPTRWGTTTLGFTHQTMCGNGFRAFEHQMDVA
jgi:hypothetical protein